MVPKVSCRSRTIGARPDTGNRCGNTPICVDGRTARLGLEWKEATTTVSFLMVPTLIEPDVILGMDLLQRLRVKINAKAEVAEPTVLVSHVQPLETWWISARKSVVFPIRNTFPEKNKAKCSIRTK